MYQVNFNILNVKNSPSVAADVAANRPTSAAIGAIYISTDTKLLQRWNGSSWDTIGGGITGTGTANYIPYWGTSSNLATTTLTFTTGGGYPTTTISGTTTTSFDLSQGDPSTSGQAAGFVVRRQSNNKVLGLLLGKDASVLSGTPIFHTYAQDDYFLKIFGSTDYYHGFYKNGNVSINTQIDAGFKLDVNGNTRIYGVLNVNDSSAYGLQFNPSANGPFTLYGSYPSYRIKTSLAGDNRVVLESTGPTGALSLYYGTSQDIFIAPNGSCWMGSASYYAFGKNSAPTASCLVEFSSVSLGVRMPVMTTTQKNAISTPASGLIIFDSTLAKMCIYTGSAWQTITSA